MNLQKLKILEMGFNSLTGVAGGIEFENGVSVEPISREQASRLAAAIRCEFVGGSNPSPSGVMAEKIAAETPIVEKMPVSKPVEVKEPEEAPEAPEKVKATYTRESLELLADKKGIVGVRDIADDMDVRSNSIAGLIDGILKKQG